MRYMSTRSRSSTATLSEAVERGLAPDGGLYVPEHFPTVDLERLRSAPDLPRLAETLLQPFFAGDRLAGKDRAGHHRHDRGQRRQRLEPKRHRHK